MGTNDLVTFRYEDRPRITVSPAARAEAERLGVDVVDGPDPSNCECARLLRPLTAVTDLPDHVCAWVARESCRRWAMHALILRLHLTPGAACVGYADVPLGDGRYAVCSEVSCGPTGFGPGFPGWPLTTHLAGHQPGSPYLVLTLAMWAETEMSPGKQDHMVATPEWQTAAQWRDETMLRAGAKTGCPTLDDASGALAALGLPHSPGAARFLFGLSDRCVEGLLVTMFVLTSHPWDGADNEFGRACDDVVFVAAGSARLTSQATRRACLKHVQEVLKWWCRVPISRIEAVDGRLANPGRPHGSIDRYVDNVLRGDSDPSDAFDDYRDGLGTAPGSPKHTSRRRQFDKRCEQAGKDHRA